MNRDWGPLTLITQVGVTMAVSIVASLLLGLWIDGYFNTKPVATLLFTLIGLLVGSVSVYRMLAEAIRQASNEGGEGARGRPGSRGTRGSEQEEKEEE